MSGNPRILGAIVFGVPRFSCDSWHQSISIVQNRNFYEDGRGYHKIRGYRGRAEYSRDYDLRMLTAIGFRRLVVDARGSDSSPDYATWFA
jgi:hypothetical protein